MIDQQSLFEDMPQENLDPSGGQSGAREAERQFYDLMEPRLLKVLDDYGISHDKLSFGITKSGYSSLRYRDAVICSMKFGPKAYYITVPAGELRELESLGIEHSGVTASGSIRIPLQSPDDAGEYIAYLCASFLRAIERYPKPYSCCSHYMECSAAGRCVNTHSEIAIDCSYNYKLRKGIVFFGENRNV